MKSTATLNETQGIAANELIKTTSLLYFKEALVKQEYETCKELLGVARKAGALQSDIDEVVVGFLDGYKPAGQRGAAGANNRLGLLKEET